MPGLQGLLLAVDVAVGRVAGVLGQPVSLMAVIAEERVDGLDLLRVRDGPDLAAVCVQNLPIVVLLHTVLVPAAPVLGGLVKGGLPVLGGLFYGVRYGVRQVPLKCLVAGRGHRAPRQQGQREGEGAKYRQSFHHVLL